MTTALVWVLVTIGGYASNEVAYSPPIATYQDCKRMQDVVNKKGVHKATCAQVNIVLPSAQQK